MCEFCYYIYDGCSHRVIEITSYCPQTLWKAGMNGQLVPCKEVVYRSLLVNFTSPSKFSSKSFCWKGRSGFCRKCEIEFEMPKNIHYATYNDIPMTVIQQQFKQPTTHMAIFAPPPSFQQPYSPRYSPLKIAQLAIPQPEFDHPFIYTPYICRTIYQLLQVADQFDTDYHALAGDLYWPPNLAVYDPDPESNQWSSCALYMGVPWESILNPYFTANGGLTTADRSDIYQAVKLGWTLEDIWERSFKERGMDLDSFELFAPRPEVFPFEDLMFEACVPVGSRRDSGIQFDKRASL